MSLFSRVRLSREHILNILGYRNRKKCMASFITLLDPRLLGRKSKHKPPDSWNSVPINNPALSNRRHDGSKEKTETKNRGLLGWCGRRQLRWCLLSDTDCGIIFFILVSKILAQHLLELNLLKRFGILNSMRLGQTTIVGSRFSNKSYLISGELPQKFCWVSSPYLNPTELSQENISKNKIPNKGHAGIQHSLVPIQPVETRT